MGLDPGSELKEDHVDNRTGSLFEYSSRQNLFLERGGKVLEGRDVEWCDDEKVEGCYGLLSGLAAALL